MTYYFYQYGQIARLPQAGGEMIRVFAPIPPSQTRTGLATDSERSAERTNPRLAAFLDLPQKAAVFGSLEAFLRKP